MQSRIPLQHIFLNEKGIEFFVETKVWKKISGASCLLSGLGVYTYAVVPQEGNLLASLFPNGIGERISNYKLGISIENH